MDTSLEILETVNQRNMEQIQEENPSSNRSLVRSYMHCCRMLSAQTSPTTSSSSLATLMTFENREHTTECFKQQCKRLSDENARLSIEYHQLISTKLQLEADEQNRLYQHHFAAIPVWRRNDEASTWLLRSLMKEEIEKRERAETEVRKLKIEEQNLLRSKQQFDGFFEYLDGERENDGEKLTKLATRQQNKRQCFGDHVKRFKKQESPTTPTSIQLDEVKTDDGKAGEVKADDGKANEVNADKVKADDGKADEVKADDGKAVEVKVANPKKHTFDYGKNKEPAMKILKTSCN